MLQPVTLRCVGGALTHILADMLRATLAVPTGTFNTCFAGLFSAWPGFSLSRVRTDLTECDFVGYVRQAIVWGTPTDDPDKRPCAFGASLTFESSDDTKPQSAIGVAVFDLIAAGVLLAVGTFDTPIAFSAAGNAADFTIKLAVPGTEAPNWGIGSALT